jgi:hypothetical protein
MKYYFTFLLLLSQIGFSQKKLNVNNLKENHVFENKLQKCNASINSTMAINAPLGVYINEVMASNDITILDVNNNSSDWVEIFNNTNSIVDLANYYLSDDKTNLTKFRFTNLANQVTIPANGYLIVWASGLSANGLNHTNWSISSAGESILLVSPNGTTIVDSLSFIKQRTDVSFGRLYNNIDSLVYFSPASPNLQNVQANAYLGILEPPVVSHPSGFYNVPFSITASTTLGTTLVYSKDGSDPTSTNLAGSNFQFIENYPENPGNSTGAINNRSYISTVYAGSISVTDPSNDVIRYASVSSTYQNNPDYLINSPTAIDKCRIFKFIAEKPGYLPSEIVSKSFFINSRAFTLPIVSVQITPQKFWDYNNGINVAGVDFVTWRTNNPTSSASISNNNYKRNTGVNGSFSFFENSLLKLEKNVEIKIHGSATRAARLKSLKFSLSKSESSLNLPSLFNSNNTENFEGFIMRNSGNDFPNTYFLDASIHIVCANLNYEKQRYRPSNVFLNGEYFGILNLRERLNNDYFAIKYQISKDSIELGENTTIENTSGDYEALTTFVKSNNFTVAANYNYLLSKIDMKSFIDYTITQSYFGNNDAFFNNYGYWRYKGPSSACTNCVKDGKWRWYLFDMDLSYRSYNLPFQYFYAPTGINYYYRYIKVNSSFKTAFVNRYADLMNSNFDANNVNNVIDSLKNGLNAEMPFQISRWKMPSSLTHWTNEINNLKLFANQRKSQTITAIQNEFGIAGTYNLNVITNNQTQGYIKINSIDILPTTPGLPNNTSNWTGTYFDNIPIQITAKPKLGFKFTHWIFNGNTVLDSIITINTSSDVSYSAFFEILILSNNPTPAAFHVDQCIYKLTNWPATTAAGVFPANMKFVYFNAQDPGLNASIEGETSGSYAYTSRTRITGHNQLGFSFINTSGTNFNVGYPVGKLGGAVLALNTSNLDSVTISWKARTMTAGTRKYSMRLQFREGDVQSFLDFSPVIEYNGALASNDSITFNNIALPPSVLNKPYVQLMWRYYYNGNGITGRRDQLGVDDITIKGIKVSNSNLNNVTKITGNPARYYFNNQITNNSSVKNTSQESFEFRPGFKVESGSVFEAKIIGCQN